MPDINNSVALDIAPVKQPDVIGQISSLAQLQYLAAQGARMQADTALTNQNLAFGQGKLGAIQDYTSRIAGGANPEDALGPSGLAAYDPQGANALLSNVQTGQAIKGTRGYAANPTDPNSAAAGGPGLVNTAASAASTQSETAIKRTQLFGQLGTVMASDPSQLGRAQAAQLALSVPLGPGETAQSRQQMVKQFMALPDDQYVLAGKHFQQASMTPEAYMQASGQTAANQAAAKANYEPIRTQPGEGVTLPPGLSDVMYPGRAAGAAPAPQSALPIMAQGGAPTAMPALPAAVKPASPAPAVPGSANSFAPTAAPTAPSGTNYYTATMNRESGGNPNAINPTTGAGGLYQFLPSTAASIRASHPDLGLSPNWYLDPKQAPIGMQAFTADNAKVLASNGVAVNDKNLTMAHFLGAAGASKFIQAGAQNPDANAAALFPKEAAANPTIFYANGSQPRTLSQVYAVMTRNFGNGLTANGAAPSEGAVMAQGAPLAQPGGSVPPGFVQPGAPLPAIPGASPAVAPAAQNGVAPIVPSPTNIPAAPQTATGAPPVVPASGAAPAGAPAPAAPAIPPTGPVTLQPGMTLAQKAAIEENARGMAAAQVKQFTDAKEAYQGASTAQMKLGELQHALDQLPQNGSFLTPGAGATERIGAAKYVNTLLESAGLPAAFDKGQIANAESAQKITGGLGFDMSRTLGAREAASIVHQAISLNPGVENTPQGAKVVSAAINAGLQRQKDFYAFLSANGNSQDADLQFNRLHPPSQYVREAQLIAKAPQADIELLEAHANDPRAVAAFDQRYGAGMSRYFTGQ